jgi:hypothetical protein
MLLSDMQAGKLLFAQPPPSMPHGSAAFANFVAATHRARFADLRRRKGDGPKSILDSDAGSKHAASAARAAAAASAAASAAHVAALAARLEATELASLGDFEEGEGWMDEDLGAELNGNTSAKHTRLRAAKDAKVQKKHGGSGNKKVKGKHVGVGGGDVGGGAHVAGSTAKAVAQTRAVLPHHSADKATAARPTRDAAPK